MSARPVAVGEYVTTAGKVATIVRIQPIKLNLQVPEADAARLRPGMAVRAEVSAHPGAAFTGSVAAMNVAVDPNSRAMTVEVTEAVTLRQPQYQASELLMEALAKGFRFVEVPMTMRKRSHGQTKKGWWPVYGFRYARVLTTTWLRERHRTRRASGHS